MTTLPFNGNLPPGVTDNNPMFNEPEPDTFCLDCKWKGFEDELNEDEETELPCCPKCGSVDVITQ